MYVYTHLIFFRKQLSKLSLIHFMIISFFHYFSLDLQVQKNIKIYIYLFIIFIYFQQPELCLCMSFFVFFTVFSLSLFFFCN